MTSLIFSLPFKTRINIFFIFNASFYYKGKHDKANFYNFTN